jgi:hypothetical protein
MGVRIDHCNSLLSPTLQLTSCVGAWCFVALFGSSAASTAKSVHPFNCCDAYAAAVRLPLVCPRPHPVSTSVCVCVHLCLRARCHIVGHLLCAVSVLVTLQAQFHAHLQTLKTLKAKAEQRFQVPSRGSGHTMRPSCTYPHTSVSLPRCMPALPASQARCVAYQVRGNIQVPLGQRSRASKHPCGVEAVVRSHLCPRTFFFLRGVCYFCVSVGPCCVRG